jgi:hypothetical protein
MVDFEVGGISFSLTPETAVSLQDGSLDPDVAYMRGRLKVAGDMAAFYELLPLAGCAPFKDGLAGAR